MNTNDSSDDPRHRAEGDGPQAEAGLAALLRAAGARPAPPAQAAAEVRSAVEDAWRARVAGTAGRHGRPVQAPRRPAVRGAVPWLAAASVALVAGALWWTQLPLERAVSDAPIVQVARLDGTAQRRADPRGDWQPLTEGADVQRGDELRTAAAGSLALRRADGLEVRLGPDTQLAFDDGGDARLEAGRVYVDAGTTSSEAGAFVLDTSRGQVRHLGTQYQAALAADGTLAVAVREGSVAVTRSAESTAVARAGEQLRIAPDGVMRRDTVARHGDAWAWAEGVAPPFAIEGRTLDEFLVWAARETGRQLVYASPQVARTAEATQLRGSVHGLAPQAAVDAVLATTPDLRHAFAGSQLRIEGTRRPGG